MTVPPTAWQNYGSSSSGYAAWAHYKTMDSYANANYPNYSDAVAANYQASGITYPTSGSISKVFMHGFLYIGGTISITGGGNGVIVGSMYCATVANLGNSNVVIYYDNNVISNIKVKNSSLYRTSWQEIGNCSWPTSSANATCP